LRFRFLSQTENETEGRFETVSDIQRESRADLDSIKENDFHGDYFEGDGSQN
jgi:hypothetical protein